MSVWSNWVGKFCFIAALAVPIALSGASLPVSAQDQQDQQQPQQQLLTQQELAQLVAPIALYPDALLAQVLTASTYPLEVVMAARWSEKNPDLKGEALEDAMQKESRSTILWSYTVPIIGRQHTCPSSGIRVGGRSAP